MKNLKISILFTALVLFLAGSISAQDAIINAKDASKLAKSDDNVVLVSVRKASDYQKVHAPGALFVDLNELYTTEPARGMLKPASEIATVLGTAGISNSMKILIYDDGSEKAAGRFYWILDYLGAKDVAIVDGGMKAWRKNRLPVTKNPTNITQVTFTAKPDASKIATINQVKSAVGNNAYVIVDARTPEEYNGTAETTLRKGHIPGAVNIPHTSVLNEDGTIKSSDELNKLFSANGITNGKKVILYCETSTRAGIVYVALNKILAYPNIMVFDGAYVQWQSVSSNTVDAD